MLDGRFVDVVRLGDGAEGGAFAARERGTGARVVLKAVAHEGEPAVRLAFATLRRTASPHLPAPRELIATAEATWLVTDWVDGEALEPGPVPVATAVADTTALAHALAAIHRAGTHHGDVSLANAVRTATGGIVLVDLAQLGRRGTGTPGFLAPEVLAGGGGAPADRFALGCVALARLTGDAPWRMPDALARLTATDVRRRLAELAAAHAIPVALVGLLERLLDPDPATRLADDAAILDRLGRVAAALRDGIDLRPATTWWLPPRWTWRGVDPEPTLARLRGHTPPRLVAVAGPPHSGRARFVEELVQRLQQDGLAARLSDPDRLAMHAARPGAPWLEAWGAAASGVFGLRSAPALLDADVRTQAATLRAVAALASAAILVPVDPELGDALARVDDPHVVVVAMRPWSATEAATALGDVVDGDAMPAWTAALLAATGGWSGRFVRTAAALAAADAQTPGPAELERAAAVVAADEPELDEGLARALLFAAWVDDGALPPGIPTHLHDGARPTASAIAAARTRLGRDAHAFATVVVHERRASGATIGLRLAIDADDVGAIADALARHPDVRPGVPEIAAFVAWMRARPVEGDGSTGGLRAIAARLLLAEAAPAEALAVVEPVHATPACVLETARALQRLGRADDATARLAPLLHAADDELRLRAWGLHLRLLVDRSRASEARAWLAAHVRDDEASVGTGWGTLWLWAAFAALATGDRRQAERELQLAAAAVAGQGDVAAHGVRARVIQLLGNLAHERGDLPGAARAWTDAAAAFERAGEPVGGLALHGSLAGLAVLGVDVTAGIAHGRTAVRGLLARAQTDALVPAALHLSQLWIRTGARDEAAALADRVGELVAQKSGPATRARASRLLAECACARAAADGSATQWLAARGAFDQAARALVRAELWREAGDAHLRAAACARLGGRLDVATADVAAGRGAATRSGESDALPIALEELLLARARGDVDAVQRRLVELEPSVDLPGWVERGELERAWLVARALWSVTIARTPVGHRARERALASLSRISEAIMNKTPSIDRAAVRASLWADGERDALRELARELGDEPPGAAANPPPAVRPAAPAADPGATTERLLRIYRRLAREDRLPPLLEQVVDAVMDLTDAERGAIVVQAKPGDRLEVIREIGREGEGVQFSRSVIDRVLADGEPVLSVDAAADDRFDGSRSISHLNLRSVLAVPLVFRGEVLGAVYVDHRLRRGNFDEHDLARVEAFAELAALAVAHARALADAREQSAKVAEQHAKLGELLEAREVEVEGLRARVEKGGGDRHGLIGNAPTMQRVFKLIDRLADTAVPVLIHGESGTGKELVARAIHDAGPRKKGPFVAENCGAIPETLLESVLFGHARGAFTGADKARAGLFEAANGGTIFLDEVGETSPGMQTKLLRVLQEGEVRRIGENTARPVDVRVIAASNRDLDALVESGQFRRDLYYRIHVVRLELPPLRERPEDIPALVRHFAARHGRAELEVAPAALRVLAAHAWPGNVRELENEVLRWVALCDGVVEAADLSPSMHGTPTTAADPDDLRIRPRVDRLERDLIARAMTKAKGNQTRAAELLGLSRFGLQKKLRRTGGPDDDEA